MCVHVSQVCDGWSQCPQHDDELYCNLTCPSLCTCYGHAYTCIRAPFLASDYPDLRSLDAEGSGMHPDDFHTIYFLIALSVAKCGLTYLGNTTFSNLQSLDLSLNLLNTISYEDLGHFPKVMFLSFVGNPLVSVFNTRKDNALFPVLLSLDMSHVEMEDLDPEIFRAFENVQTLNLSQSRVQRVSESGFQSLKSLQELDMRGCPLTTMPKSMFRGLKSLNHVLADNYKVCCPAMLPEGFPVDNCLAPVDEISSCRALLRSDLYRTSLAVFAMLASVGNAVSFVFRVFVLKNKHQSGFAVFVTHLCVADFLMGVYLVLIGAADRLYLGSYMWQEIQWKSSTTCKLTGFVSMLSSEVSAAIICVITLDRFLVIRFPFSRLRFQRGSAQLVSGLLWTMGLFLSAVPLLPVTSHWQFYSQTGICLPLPVTRQNFPGQDYSFGVMIVFNFVLFLCIAAGQVSVFAAIHSQSMAGMSSDRKSTSSDRRSLGGDRKSKDLAVAQRLIVVVASDFLCWFPIGLLGLLASRDVPIPGEVNVGMAIFVLPLNSALNPFLYSLNVVRDRRHRAREEKLLRMMLAPRKDESNTIK